MIDLDAELSEGSQLRLAALFFTEIPPVSFHGLMATVF